MNHSSTIDSWIAAIFGVAGGSIHLTLLNTTVNFWSLAMAMITAFLCGAAGVAGRHALNYFVKRWKYRK